MAKPIKETPILKGQDAKVFLSRATSSITGRVAPIKLQALKANHASFKALSKR